VLEQPIDSLLEHIEISYAPELVMLRERYGEAISASLRAAIEALEDRARAVLKYSIVFGWSIDKIGKLYGAHRATAARWLNAARELLGDNIRKEVAERCKIEPSEVDSIVRQVQSQIDVSLLRIL
jgi:RNA polymerase sigma-70 factor (ECF subfamily)